MPCAWRIAEPVAGRQLAHPFEHRQRRRDDPKRQILVQGVEIRRWRARKERQQRLDLRGERQLRSPLHVEQRLLAQMVPGHEQPAGRVVPDREGEHAAQPVKAGLAQFLVEMQHHLGVGFGGEPMALRLQLGHQPAIVVDLTVADDPLGAVLVADRLSSAFEIDDGQAPVPERGAAAQLNGAVIGAAMA